jgi:hypothetical protein
MSQSHVERRQRLLNDRLPTRRAIDELFTAMACSEQAEWRGLVAYLPL